MHKHKCKIWENKFIVFKVSNINRIRCREINSELPSLTDDVVIS